MPLTWPAPSLSQPALNPPMAGSPFLFLSTEPKKKLKLRMSKLTPSLNFGPIRIKVGIGHLCWN